MIALSPKSLQLKDLRRQIAAAKRTERAAYHAGNPQAYQDATNAVYRLEQAYQKVLHGENK